MRAYFEHEEIHFTYTHKKKTHTHIINRWIYETLKHMIALCVMCFVAIICAWTKASQSLDDVIEYMVYITGCLVLR